MTNVIPILRVTLKRVRELSELVVNGNPYTIQLSLLTKRIAKRRWRGGFSGVTFNKSRKIFFRDLRFKAL